MLIELLERDADAYSEDIALLLGQIDPGNETAVGFFVSAIQYGWVDGSLVEEIANSTSTHERKFTYPSY